MKQIEVVAAIIRKAAIEQEQSDARINSAEREQARSEIKEDKIFATQRGYGEWKDWWEFPGGKMEAGETPEDALKREIQEELSTEISVDEFLCTVEYDYPAFHLKMHCYLCSLLTEALHLNEHEAAKWLTKEELDSVKWLPADLEVVEKMKQMERIERMEQNLERVMHAAKGTNDALDENEAVQEALRELEAYYGSDMWKQDFEDDEQGKLPKNLKRGVLSEDAIWNVLEDRESLRT